MNINKYIYSIYINPYMSRSKRVYVLTWIPADCVREKVVLREMKKIWSKKRFQVSSPSLLSGRYRIPGSRNQSVCCSLSAWWLCLYALRFSNAELKRNSTLALSRQDDSWGTPVESPAPVVIRTADREGNRGLPCFDMFVLFCSSK